VLAPAGPILAGQFKARCLQLMDEVEERGVEFVITKYGRPVAKLVPVVEKPQIGFGSMKGTVKILGDIISPIEDLEWGSDPDLG
jgi:prevent-host-death family protein